MNKLILGTVLTSLVAAGVVFASGETNQSAAVPAHEIESVDQNYNADFDLLTPVKKCSFQSDCPYGKCKSGMCGGCDFQSDCKGWGKCKSGQCGGCDFQSDCKDFGGCSSGRCKKSPY